MEEMHHSVTAEEDDDIDGIGPKPYGTNNDGYKSDPKSRYEEEESDDGVFEFELERAMEKIHTHTAYCPNCSCELTKVVLGGPKKEGILEMNVYFDNGEGITLRWSLSDNNVMNVEDLDIPKLVNDVIEKVGNDHVKDEVLFLSGLPAPRLRSRTRDQEDDIDVKIEIVEESDDNQEDQNQMREFDLFKRAVDKLPTNSTAYCPYCSCQINKVILRRKRPPCVAVPPCDVTTKQVHEILPCGKTDLFGCLPSCFHFLLLCSGNKQENISVDEYNSTEALLSTCTASDVDPDLPHLRLSFSEAIDTGLEKVKLDHEITTAYLPSGDVSTIDEARHQTGIPDHEIKDEEREINIVEYRMDGYASSQITKITLRLLKKAKRSDI